MGIWRCTKCGMVQGGINKPLVGVCSKGGGHRWSQGSDSTSKPCLYICGKCGTVTSSMSKPMDRNCLRGGRCSWRKYKT